jgi:hypothetical protein
VAVVHRQDRATPEHNRTVCSALRLGHRALPRDRTATCPNDGHR